jgi:tRNA-binding protein
MSIPYEIFEKVDLRSGVVVQAELFERAKKPAYKVWVDFGPEIGIKKNHLRKLQNIIPLKI